MGFFWDYSFQFFGDTVLKSASVFPMASSILIEGNVSQKKDCVIFNLWFNGWRARLNLLINAFQKIGDVEHSR